jgi:tetratricopeptide (TPR) repeat protein
MITRTVLAMTAALMSSAAWAGSEIRYAEPDAWVEQADVAAILKEKPESNNFFVVLERQVKIEKGELRVYADLAMRMQSAEMLTQVGTLLRGMWHPDRGDIIIHRLQILRKGQVINTLENGTKFEVIRQEAGLNQLQINGILTATAQITGLQLGDIVRFSFTSTGVNDALGGRAEFSTVLPTEQITTDFDRLRFVWPKAERANYKMFGENLTSKIAEKNGYSELTLPIIAPKQTEMPEDGPQRFKIKPNVAITQFDTWEDVSKATAQLYKLDGTIPAGSELEAEVTKIASASQDPKVRTAMAVRLVQDKIRYLYNGLGFGNYTPQSPSETWKLRYGDCKAKTMLLVAMLDRLGVKAQPVLTSVSLKDGVSTLPPGFLAFDHIIVRATVGDKTYWLDGTGSGTRITDLEDVPPHRMYLPIAAEGSGLIEVAPNLPGRPQKNVTLRYDMSTGLAVPAFFDVEIKLQGEEARKLNSSQQQKSAAAFREELEEATEKYLTEAILVENGFSYDEEKAEAKLTGRGVAYLGWVKKKGAISHDIWSVIDSKEITADRKKREWRTVPLDLGSGWHYREATKFQLPKTATPFRLDGMAEVAETVGGFKLARKTELKDGAVSFYEDYHLGQWELPATELSTETRKISRMQDKDVKIIAPADFPDAWAEMAALISGNKLAEHKRAFDKIVANNPGKELPYRQRAYFYDLIGDVAKADKDLAQAIKLEPDAETLRWRGRLLRKTDPKTAIALLEESIKLEPDQYGAVETLVEIHGMAGRAKEAEAAIDRSFKNGLSDSDAEALKAYAALLARDTKKAMTLLDEMVDKEPDEAGRLGSRCWYRALANTELEGALEDCTKSIELSENPSSTLDSRGLVYLQMGKLDEAIADYDAALELAPDQSSTYYQRSIAHARAGHKAESDRDRAAALFHSRNAAMLFDYFGIKP